MARQDNFGVGRFDILASFASQSDVLRSGLEARGEVVLEKRDRVLRVPRSALREVDKHFFVSLPGKNGPQRALVGIGLVGDEFVEIVSGLQANHRVYEAYVDASR